MRYTTRPLSDRTWLRQRPRTRSQFTTSWADTLEQLEREIGYLSGRDVVFEIDVREQDLKLDGTLRSNARTPGEPAVVVAFESKHGPLMYRCDRYDAPPWSHDGPREVWKHNVRAITLTLEAQRAQERYGATESGQQYTGWKQLGAGSGIGLASGMTLTRAIEVIGENSIYDTEGEVQVLEDWIKSAKIRSHPDKNKGDRTAWNEVEQAERVLRRSGKVIA